MSYIYDFGAQRLVPADEYRYITPMPTAPPAPTIGGGASDQIIAYLSQVPMYEPPAPPASSLVRGAYALSEGLATGVSRLIDFATDAHMTPWQRAEHDLLVDAGKRRTVAQRARSLWDDAPYEGTLGEGAMRLIGEAPSWIAGWGGATRAMNLLTKPRFITSMLPKAPKWTQMAVEEAIKAPALWEIMEHPQASDERMGLLPFVGVSAALPAALGVLGKLARRGAKETPEITLTGKRGEQLGWDFGEGTYAHGAYSEWPPQGAASLRRKLSDFAPEQTPYQEVAHQQQTMFDAHTPRTLRSTTGGETPSTDQLSLGGWTPRYGAIGETPTLFGGDNAFVRSVLERQKAYDAAQAVESPAGKQTVVDVPVVEETATIATEAGTPAYTPNRVESETIAKATATARYWEQRVDSYMHTERGTEHATYTKINQTKATKKALRAQEIADDIRSGNVTPEKTREIERMWNAIINKRNWPKGTEATIKQEHKTQVAEMLEQSRREVGLPDVRVEAADFHAASTAQANHRLLNELLALRAQGARDEAVRAAAQRVKAAEKTAAEKAAAAKAAAKSEVATDKEVREFFRGKAEPENAPRVVAAIDNYVSRLAKKFGIENLNYGTALTALRKKFRLRDSEMAEVLGDTVGNADALWNPIRILETTKGGRSGTIHIVDANHVSLRFDGAEKAEVLTAAKFKKLTRGDDPQLVVGEHAAATTKETAATSDATTATTDVDIFGHYAGKSPIRQKFVAALREAEDFFNKVVGDENVIARIEQRAAREKGSPPPHTATRIAQDLETIPKLREKISDIASKVKDGKFPRGTKRKYNTAVGDYNAAVSTFRENIETVFGKLSPVEKEAAGRAVGRQLNERLPVSKSFVDRVREGNAVQPGAIARVRDAAQRMDDAAKKYIRENQNRLSFMPVDIWAAYVASGVAKLITKGANFASWSAAMVRDFGSGIKPHLRDIHKESVAQAAKSDGSLTALGGSPLRSVDALKPGQRFESISARDAAYVHPGRIERLNKIDNDISRIGYNMRKLTSEYKIDDPLEATPAFKKKWAKLQDSLEKASKARDAIADDVATDIRVGRKGDFSRLVSKHLDLSDNYSNVRMIDDVPHIDIPGGATTVYAPKVSINSYYDTMLRTPASLFQQYLAPVRDVLTESVMRPLRDAHRASTKFKGHYGQRLSSILKKYEHDAAGRERLSAILEDRLPSNAPAATAEEKQVCKELREWLDELYKEFNIGTKAEYVKEYFPHIAKFTDRSATEIRAKLRTELKEHGMKLDDLTDDELLLSIDQLMMGDKSPLTKFKVFRELNEIPEVGEFFATLPRSGHLAVYETDVFKALWSYLNRGTQTKYMEPALESLLPVVDTMHPTRKRVFANLAENLLSRPSEGEIAANVLVSDVLNTFMKQFGKTAQRGRFANNISAFVARLSYLGTVGFNPFTAMKNLTQQLLAVGTLSPSLKTNLHYWKKAVTNLNKPESEELLKHCWVMDQRVYQEGLRRQYDFITSMRGADAKFSQVYSLGNRAMNAADKYGFHMFQWSDRVNVKTSYLMKMQYELEQGVAFQTAAERANKFAADTQFLYGVDSPMLYKHPLGRQIGLLMSWPLNFFRLMGNMMRAGQHREVAQTMGILVGGSAALGMTGLEFSYIAPISAAQGWLPLAVLSGGGAGQSPLALQQVDAAVGLATTYLSSESTVEDKERAAYRFRNNMTTFVPGSVQWKRMAKVVKALENDMTVHDRFDRPQYKMSGSEAALQLLGPTKESTRRHKEHVSIAKADARYKQLRSKAVRAYFDGDHAAFNKHQAKLRDEFGKGLTKTDIKREQGYRSRSSMERHRAQLPKEIQGQYPKDLTVLEQLLRYAGD